MSPSLCLVESLHFADGNVKVKQKAAVAKALPKSTSSNSRFKLSHEKPRKASLYNRCMCTHKPQLISKFSQYLPSHRKV